ncbi:hypothetical protein SHO565_32210 [Streptomyces sp. HO565]
MGERADGHAGKDPPGSQPVAQSAAGQQERGEDQGVPVGDHWTPVSEADSYRPLTGTATSMGPSPHSVPYAKVLLRPRLPNRTSHPGS